MPFPKEVRYTAEEFFKLIPESNSELYELLEGEIVALASPGTLHQRIVGEIFFEIKNYIKTNKGICKPFISPYDVKLDEYTVVIPDILVVCDPSKIDDKRCNGAPDFVIEVTSGNRSDDFVRKLVLYKEAGVREYWIVDTQNKKTVVYFFDESDSPNIYTFEQSIPVGIYSKNEIKLEINIAQLLE